MFATIALMRHDPALRLAVLLSVFPSRPGFAPARAVLLPTGGAIHIAIPIAFPQDLMSARPGTGSSLLALQGIAGNAAAALAFVAGTALSGYRLAAAFGAMLAVSAGLALVRVDARAQVRVKKPFGA